MTTTRTPIHRPPGGARITPKAIELFIAMEAVECTCEERDWTGQYWKHTPCAGCDRWSALHSQLCDEFKAKPWQWPVYESLDAENPYPTGSPAAQHWARRREDRPEAFALYEALSQAAKSR